MTTTTFDHASAGYAEKRGPGFLRRMLDRMVEARQREADRMIARAIASHSPETLAAFGLTREELLHWHAKAAK